MNTLQTFLTALLLIVSTVCHASEPISRYLGNKFGHSRVQAYLNSVGKPSSHRQKKAMEKKLNKQIAASKNKSYDIRLILPQTLTLIPATSDLLPRNEKEKFEPAKHTYSRVADQTPKHFEKARNSGRQNFLRGKTGNR